MKYDFFLNKTIREIRLLPENGLLIEFDKGDWVECYTKFSSSIEGYDLNKIIRKKVEKVLYEKDKIISFCFDDVIVSFSLLPNEWVGPEDVVYKNYNDAKKLIIEVIE